MDNKKLRQKKKLNKIIAAFLVMGIIMVLFFLGIFSTNIIMKLAVGHGNEVLVPNLIGINFPKAADICKDSDLYIQDISREYSNFYPVGHIIEQDPKDSTIVKKYRTINVVLSKGVKLIKMPLLIGADLDLVKTQIDALGLKIGKISRYYNQEIRKNVVISTVPAAGEDVEMGGSVDIDVSLGSLKKTKNGISESGNSYSPSNKNDAEEINYEDLFQ